MGGNDPDRSLPRIPSAYSGERPVKLVYSEEELHSKIPKACPVCQEEHVGPVTLGRLTSYSDGVVFPVLARAGETQVLPKPWRSGPVYYDFLGWRCPACGAYNAFEEIYRLMADKDIGGR